MEVSKSGGSSLEATLAWWKAFDLEARRKALDEAGIEIAAKQDASADARKALGEAVKSFKKLATDEEKVAQITPLLKLFQGEIDQLTLRSRFSEKSFLSLVKDLFDAPDPAPALSASMDTARQLTRSHEECLKLQAEVNELRAKGTSAAVDNEAETARLKRDVEALE